MDLQRVADAFVAAASQAAESAQGAYDRFAATAERAGGGFAEFAAAVTKQANDGELVTRARDGGVVATRARH